ncbi:MAG: four helix bundle protein [Balneolaceae bacterium]|nr:four helix bundle protein [Balneolaceae bacterium]
MELCWNDTQQIIDSRFFSLADQLFRSTGAISATMTEGYSRNSKKEKARFYEIALGSARESKDWYFKSRKILEEEIAFHRIKLLTSIIKLLLTMINEKRSSYKVAEPKVYYFYEELDQMLNAAD